MDIRNQRRYGHTVEVGLDLLLICGAEAAKLARDLSRTYGSWDQPQWDELDWSHIKELTTRDILEHRKRAGIKAQSVHALDCPNFVKHVRISVVHPLQLSVLIKHSFPCVTTNGSSTRTSLS